MRTLESYLTEYAQSHQNPANVRIHTLCVPLIMWSLLGVFHVLNFEIARGSHLLAALALIYYAAFRKPGVFFLMSAQTALMLLSFEFIPNLLPVSIAVFTAAWIGQFYGHKLEGKKPSFFKDLLFLLIGPVWVLKKLFPRWI